MLKIRLPKTDRGRRGYSDRYISKIQRDFHKVRYYMGVLVFYEKPLLNQNKPSREPMIVYNVSRDGHDACIGLVPFISDSSFVNDKY